jgi:hypothetical protein
MIQFTWLQPHGYRNGQKVLYKLLLITVSVSDLDTLQEYYYLQYKLKYSAIKYGTILIHVALIKHIQKAYGYSGINKISRFNKPFCSELYIKTYTYKIPLRRLHLVYKKKESKYTPSQYC